VLICGRPGCRGPHANRHKTSADAVILVEKTGQVSGTSQMGDQTGTNMKYFATVTADNLTGRSNGKGTSKAESNNQESD
jgi:hypothetical protein